MEQGRQLWTDLAALGRRFEEVDRQLSEVKQPQKKPRPWIRTGLCLKRSRSLKSYGARLT